eukprot:6469988-Amphidinium_carterae.2
MSLAPMPLTDFRQMPLISSRSELVLLRPGVEYVYALPPRQSTASVCIVYGLFVCLSYTEHLPTPPTPFKCWTHRKRATILKHKYTY